MRVVCIKCGYQDEPSEMRPVNRRTLFGDLVDDSKWLCSDCDGDIETERERGKALTTYNVIDNDPYMNYDPGEEVIGTTQAESPKQAIDQVMNQYQPVQDLKALDPEGFSKYVLSTISAEVLCQPDDLSGRNSRRAKLHELTHEDNY